MIDAVADEVVRRSYYPGPVALMAHRSKAQVKLAWGPLGTAKTTWLCWRAKAICERAAAARLSARIIFIRDTYRNLIDSTFATWKEWFPPDSAAGYISQSEPIDFQLNVGGRYHQIEFRYGQTEQDASKFLSTEYDGIMLEEIAPAYIPGKKLISPGISEGIFDMAISRLTRKKDRAAAIRPELAMTCNPPPLNHWGSTRIIDKSAEYLRAANWAHFYFGIEDNIKNIRPDYYSNLELAWEGKRALIQRFLHGKRLPVFVGIPRFNLDQLDRMLERAQEPAFKGYLKDVTGTPDDNPLHIKLEANENGYVKIWKPPRVGSRYVIGGDAAEGIVDGGDYSSAHVLDLSDYSIAAAWHGHMEPEKYGEQVWLLAKLYNDAKIGIESYPSAHGLTALTWIRNKGYTRIFYSQNLETRKTNQQQRIGWRSNSATKTVMVDGIGSYLDVKPDPVIVDGELISELQTYGLDEHGRTNAQEGCFDDRVVSFGVALYIAKFAGISRYFPSAA